MMVKKVAWNSWRFTSTSTQAEEEVVCRLSNTILQFRNTFETNSSSAVWGWERNGKDLEVERIFDNIRCTSGNATSAESKKQLKVKKTEKSKGHRNVRKSSAL